MNQKKQFRVDAAKLREEARSKRSDREQLAVLDSRLGVGVGAKRERARLEPVVAPKQEEKVSKKTKKKDK